MLSARRRVAAPLACVIVLSTTAPGSARAADPPKPAADAASAAAHQHAARAHELYQQGSYHEAIVELDAALKLDPNGKDLVYNLAVVHEKLGDIADAIHYFERYERMDLSPAERAKAETFMKRLQGAQKEVEKPADQAPPPPQTVTVIQAAPPEKHYGRFDWITGAATVIGVGGIAVGTVFGVRALVDRPKSGVTTTDTYSYAQYANSQEKAHNEAIVSDVSFAIGAAGLAAAIILFFARARDSAPAPAGSAGSALPRVVVSGTPVRGGGAVVLEARF